MSNVKNQVNLDPQSSLSPHEAEMLIGKKVIGVKNWEFGLTLYFDGGIELNCEGHKWEDSALDVSVTKYD